MPTVIFADKPVQSKLHQKSQRLFIPSLQVPDSILLTSPLITPELNYDTRYYTLLNALNTR